jgi:lipopolysaccharide export LptBFGC system permease protein LptF
MNENTTPLMDVKIRKKDDKDYWKKYYAEHKEKLLQQKKEWRENNKDRINNEKKKEYQKKYDEEHKEQIKQRREKLVLCECGDEVKQFSIQKHKLSKLHKLKCELNDKK